MTTDVIPYGMAWGNHARLEGLNLVGLKRRGFSRDQINTLRAAFRAIFLGAGSFAERVSAAADTYAASPQVMEIVDFIRAEPTRPLRRRRPGPGLDGRLMRKLGLIAGGGALPQTLAAHCRQIGRPYHVIRLRGFADPELAEHPGGEAGIAEIGRVSIRLAKEAGCEALCFAGVVRRPDFAAIKPDLRGLAALPGAILAARKGDEALLRYLMVEFEKDGFAIEGALYEVMGELTLAARPDRPLRTAQPKRLADDIAKAVRIAREIGALDIGQGAVVCEGLVLAVEAQEGHRRRAAPRGRAA